MFGARSWFLTLAMLVAILVGGATSTAAWMYLSNNAEAGSPVESSSPVPALVPTAASGLASSPTSPPSAPSPAAPLAAANVDSGKKIFADSCASCHPSVGQGFGPALSGAAFQAKYADDAALKAVIASGKGAMPAFRQLTDSQLNDVVAYLRTQK